MQVGDTEIEVYLSDLNPDAQKKFLDAMNMESESDGNYEVFPIAVIPIAEEE